MAPCTLYPPMTRAECALSIRHACVMLWQHGAHMKLKLMSKHNDKITVISQPSGSKHVCAHQHIAQDQHMRAQREAARRDSSPPSAENQRARAKRQACAVHCPAPRHHANAAQEGASQIVRDACGNENLLRMSPFGFTHAHTHNPGSASSGLAGAEARALKATRSALPTPHHGVTMYPEVPGHSASHGAHRCRASLSSHACAQAAEPCLTEGLCPPHSAKCKPHRTHAAVTIVVPCHSRP